MCPPRSPENIGVNPFRALVYHFRENPFVAGNFIFFFFFAFVKRFAASVRPFSADGVRLL